MDSLTSNRHRPFARATAILCARTFVLATFVTLYLASSAFAQDAIRVATVIPYADRGDIAQNVLEECDNLGSHLAEKISEQGTKRDVPISLVEDPNPGAGGRALVVHIDNAISGGNAFIGHRKSVTVTAELFVNGKSVGKEKFTRDSGGGFFGGYQGSCSVLRRCTKTLGKDIVKWIQERQ